MYVIYRALTRLEPEFFISLSCSAFFSPPFRHNDGIVRLRREERRDSFIYPLVFIFCFEKWAEPGLELLRPGGGATQDDGEVGPGRQKASKAGGLSRKKSSAVLQETGRLNLTNT